MSSGTRRRWRRARWHGRLCATARVSVCCGSALLKGGGWGEAGSGRLRRGRVRGSDPPGAGPMAAQTVQASGKSWHLSPDDVTPKHVPHGSFRSCEQLSGQQNGSRAGVESPGALSPPQRPERTALFTEQQAARGQGHQPCYVIFCFFPGTSVDLNLALRKHSHQKFKGVHGDSVERREAFSGVSRCKRGVL